MRAGRRSVSAGSVREGDRYLRALLIHGARAVVGTLFRKNVMPRPWLLALAARRPTNVTAVAVAHKTARALWAMLTREEKYRKPIAAAPSAKQLPHCSYDQCWLARVIECDGKPV
jgi:transposase